MATIFINDLRVDTVIGLCEWERHVEQSLYFDVAMATDIGSAADGDDLDKTIDYAAVATQVESFVKDQNCLLLETLVQRLMKYLLQHHLAIAEITVTIRKPQAIAKASCAGITASISR